MEHCYDPNKVLKKFIIILIKALILISARGIPRSSKKIYFNHNHHRYFFIQFYGPNINETWFQANFSTIFPITGDVAERKMNYFVL